MKKLSIFLIAITLLALTSCLKHDVYIQEPSQSSSVIMIAKTGDPISSSTTSLYSGYSADLGVVEVGDTIGFNINVEYGGVDDAPSDIVVNLGIDTAKLRVYNTQNGTSYVVPTNAAMYTFPSSVTIKKGTRLAQGRAVITVTSDFDFNLAYALPITISYVSSGTISSNGGTAIYYCPARNQYDGVYNLSGYHNRSPYNYEYTNVPMKMITMSANSVAFYYTARSSYGHPIGTATGLSWYGATMAPVITFDPTTNLVTDVYNMGGTTPISIYSGSGSGQGRFDPKTKTIYVYWRYSANDERAFIDTLVYVGAR